MVARSVTISPPGLIVTHLGLSGAPSLTLLLPFLISLLDLEACSGSLMKRLGSASDQSHRKELLSFD